jgi:lipoprotein NlpD
VPAKSPAKRPAKAPERHDVSDVAVPNLGRWKWPHHGAILKNWGARKHQKSGLDIAAKPGGAVTASAAGVVVYSGGGLARYGQLIIVKHSEELLSAYAYNQSLLVKKGQRIRAGEKIALSGRSPDGVGAVHFEIRRRGKPVDALQYLKKRSG